jgi:hypothetical protein
VEEIKMQPHRLAAVPEVAGDGQDSRRRRGRRQHRERERGSSRVVCLQLVSVVNYVICHEPLLFVMNLYFAFCL